MTVGRDAFDFCGETYKASSVRPVPLSVNLSFQPTLRSFMQVIRINLDLPCLLVLAEASESDEVSAIETDQSIVFYSQTELI
jgi:hypothetical protein